MQLIKFFWKPISWGLIVIVLSAMDTGGIDKPGLFDFPHFDKVVHVSIYMVFTFLFSMDLMKSGIAGASMRNILFTSFTTANLFGAGMELMQMIPALNRNASVSDIFANMAGSLAAVVLFVIFSESGVLFSSDKD